MLLRRLLRERRMLLWFENNGMIQGLVKRRLREFAFPKMIRSSEFEMSKDETSRIAVAVSGGPDSLALCVLVRNWAVENHVDPSRIKVFTVDHGLRGEESRNEVEKVRIWTSEHTPFQHDFRTIQWDDDDDKSTVKSHAKTKPRREYLLQEMCEAHGIDTLLLGHHADDQIETMIQRIFKASGLSGLASIPTSRRLGYHGTILFRPLLTFQKERLIETCKAYGLNDYVVDPSNENKKYDRARIRDILRRKDHHQHYSNITSLLSLTETCRDADSRVRDEILKLLTRDKIIRTNDFYNFAMLDLVGFQKCNNTLKRRVLSYLFSFVSPFESYKVKSETVERFMKMLMKGGEGGEKGERLRLKQNFTAALGLAGPWERDGSAVLFTRENQRFNDSRFVRMSSKSIEQTNRRRCDGNTEEVERLPELDDEKRMIYARCVWDSRFVLHCRVPRFHETFLENLRVDVLKEHQWRRLIKTETNLRYLGSLPAKARVVLPVIFGTENLVSEKQERRDIRKMRRNSKNDTCWIQDREGNYLRVEWADDVLGRKYGKTKSKRRGGGVSIENTVVAIPHLGWIRPDVAKVVQGLGFHIKETRVGTDIIVSDRRWW